MSFFRTDRLRLIEAPQELILAFREMLNSLKMLQSESWKDKRGEVLEFKMCVFPSLLDVGKCTRDKPSDSTSPETHSGLTNDRELLGLAIHGSQVVRRR